MGGSFGMNLVGFIVLLIAVNIIRVMWMANVFGGGGRKAARIADKDAHLTFDERIAERMRELDRDKALAEPVERVPAPPTSPLRSRDASVPRPTFGRRAL